MTLDDFNMLSSSDAELALSQCCGATRWHRHMRDRMPYQGLQELQSAAISTWYDQCSKADWLEAFTHHPKIGDLDNLKKKFAATADLAGSEQAHVHLASVDLLEKLASANTAYEAKFGYIFIVCATGKSAGEMYALISARMHNTPAQEIRVAMGEQAKITALRLGKLLNHEIHDIMGRSQITTHILDTSRGMPGEGIGVKLMSHSTEPSLISQGISNADGRIEDLLPAGRVLSPGTYTIAFDTQAYFEKLGVESFYPTVEIRFSVTDDQHYHVPLLLNPFGYSTYRGS